MACSCLRRAEADEEGWRELAEGSAIVSGRGLGELEGRRDLRAVSAAKMIISEVPRLRVLVAMAYIWIERSTEGEGGDVTDLR